MRFNRFIFAVIIALTLSGGGAMAFKDVPAVSSVGEKSNGEKKLESKTQPQLKMKTPDTTATTDKSDKGVELRIPGIGRLGTLPKLDFGLELLYGTNEDSGEESVEQQDGLTIKGSVKRRF